ncbi:hypothetical protein AGMMS50268_20780 [Spirochaetia bacterium]|nr:hypothetical protein AGMMS50268_20780 [Spirochaetia bacterium]
MRSKAEIYWPTGEELIAEIELKKEILEINYDDEWSRYFYTLFSVFAVNRSPPLIQEPA